MKVSEISAKAKDFLWKRLEVTSLRKGSKSPFFRIGYLLKNISKQFNSFPRNRRSQSKKTDILFLLHLRPGLFAVQFTTYIMFKVQKLLWDYCFDEYLMNSWNHFVLFFPPFTDKVVFSYYASWVMFFTRPWSHLTWIFQWSFRVTAESRKLADKLHTMNSCFQILHRSVDAKGSTQCIFVQNWYP